VLNKIEPPVAVHLGTEELIEETARLAAAYAAGDVSVAVELADLGQELTRRVGMGAWQRRELVLTVQDPGSALMHAVSACRAVTAGQVRTALARDFARGDDLRRALAGYGLSAGVAELPAQDDALVVLYLGGKPGGPELISAAFRGTLERVVARLLHEVRHGRPDPGLSTD
jgi:hypothetical protein